MNTNFAGSPLLHHTGNVTSQFGEDGIIEEIFRRIGPKTKTCVEFGAWDGKHLSNTYRLWHSENWRALLIEGDSQRFEQLRRNIENNPLVTAVNAFVTLGGRNTLDSIIERTGFETQPDLVSIDVDGDDYHIVCSLNVCRPRVLAVEYNPTIPPEMDFYQLPGEAVGASASAVVRAASGKGYKISCMTDSNCIFVRSDEFHKLQIPDFDFVESFPRRYLSNIIADYRGNCYLTSKPMYSKMPAFRLNTLLKLWMRRRRDGSMAANCSCSRSGCTPVYLFPRQGFSCSPDAQ